MKLELLTPAVFEPYLRPARYKGLYGGRYSMKSHHHAEGVLERCVEDPGSRIACLREKQKSLRFSSKQLIEDKIRQYNAGYYFDVQDKVIKIHGDRGGIIIFEGLQDHTAESIKSLEGFDVFWTTEAQVITQRSLNILRPTVRKTPRMSRDPEMWFDWNPRMRTDAVDLLFRGSNPPPDSICLRVNWRDNPWLDDKMLADILADRERDGSEFAHVWEGDYYSDHANQLIAYGWVLDARDGGTRMADGTPGWHPDGSEPQLMVLVDVADGGPDFTVVTVMRRYQSFDVLLKQKSYKFPPSEAPIDTADRAEELFKDFGGDKLRDVLVVDANGVGSGTAGTLIKRGYAVARYVGGSRADDTNKYRNRRAQAHISLRDAFRDHRLVIDSDAFEDNNDWMEFVDQVCSVRRKPGNDRLEELETKEHLVHRTGKSPDRCESLALGYCMLMPEHVLSGSDITIAVPSAFDSATAGYDGAIAM